MYVTVWSRLKLQVLPSDEVTLILFPDGLELAGLGTDEGGILELGVVLVGVVRGDLELE